jgi:hypothetical protein
LISSKKGSTYGDLSYILNSVNFVTIHNSDSYFGKPIKRVAPNLKLLKLRTAQQNRLLFMGIFKPSQPKFKVTSIKNTDTNFVNFFHKSGLFHVIGHGDQRSIDSLGLIHMNKLIVSSKSKTSNIEKFNINRKLKADLIVLNNCYSGTRDPIVILYDKGLYLQLMYFGASNVIAATDKVDDYVSSELFKYYYHYIAEGWSFDVALSMAQRKFLKKNNNQYACPNYWYPYFVISSRRVKF